MTLLASHSASRCPTHLLPCRSRAACAHLGQQAPQPRCCSLGKSSRRVSFPSHRQKRSVSHVAAPDRPVVEIVDSDEDSDEEYNDESIYSANGVIPESFFEFEDDSDEDASDEELYDSEEDTEVDEVLYELFAELLAKQGYLDADDKPLPAPTRMPALDDDTEVDELQYRQGDKLIGTVESVSERFAYIDIGSKHVAVCPTPEISLAKVQRATQAIRVGEQREFVVLRDAGVKEDEVLVSMRRFEEEICWKRVRQLSDENITVLGKVTGVNEGGLILKVENLEGFVPMSHVAGQVDDAEALMGESIPVKFLEMDEERGRLVFSARKVANEKQFQAYSIGDVAEGVIQSIKPYGAFIDLGNGMSGLLHISQISMDRVTNVGSILAEGDKLKVMVLSTDKDRGRMSLSTKKLEPTAGDMLRDTQLVYDKADEMAALFKQRLAEAESVARAEGIGFPSAQGYDMSYDAPYGAQGYAAGQSGDSQDDPDIPSY